MLNLTAEICRKHWQSAEGGLDKAREHRSSVSCWCNGDKHHQMTSQHSHHFCNYAIRFQTTIAKTAKMMEGLWPLRNARNFNVSMAEHIVRQVKSCSSIQWRVLIADLVLRPARTFHMNPRNRNVTGNHSLLECDAALGTSGSQCWRWMLYVHSKHREPPPQQCGITSRKARALYCHRNVKCCLQTSLLSEYWWVSVSDVVPSSFIWM
jgi:hypothetical protein